MKIPTIVGIALLLVAVSLGVFIYHQNQLKDLKQSAIVAPSDIEVANITGTQATVIWQTKTPASGLVSFGTNQFLGDSQNDDRDKDNPQDRLSHFVTLTNLSPNTTYFYRVRSGPYFYPDSPLSFKSAPASSSTNPESTESATLNQPIFGAVIDSNLLPVEDAIVLLKVDGAQDLATLTSTAGNFILPLVNLKKQNLTDSFQISDQTPANLYIKQGNLASTVKITLPSNNKPLPKITLGQNADLTSVVPEPSPSAPPSNPYDLNKDGVINTLDEAIVIDNFNRSSSDPLYNPQADLNQDGKVDQQDLNLIKQVISR